MKLIAALSFFFSITAQAAWDLNDVSFLMPIPQKPLENSLLRMKTPARGGELLAERLVLKLPLLTLGMTQEEAIEALRVMAVRIDPCFPLPTPLSCQPQIRLVWQPLEVNRRNQTQTVDATFHSFHVLSTGEFESLLKELQLWQKKFPAKTEQLPLQIHPAWAAEGDKSHALVEFQEIITRYAGMGNLTRLTMMVLRGAGDMWAFAGFEMKAGELKMFPVPRLPNGQLSQGFVNMAVPADYFEGGGMSPIPSGPDTLNTIVADSRVLDATSEEVIRQEIKAAYRIENPKNFTPENMDCVSCHVAQPAIQWALKSRSHLNLDQLWAPEIYKNTKYDLSNVSEELPNTQMVRAFGYFGRSIAISQRVINESAEVADYLNRIAP